jgi:hypothetical protein
VQKGFHSRLPLLVAHLLPALDAGPPQDGAARHAAFQAFFARALAHSSREAGPGLVAPLLAAADAELALPPAKARVSRVLTAALRFSAMAVAHRGGALLGDLGEALRRLQRALSSDVLLHSGAAPDALAAAAALGSAALLVGSAPQLAAQRDAWAPLFALRDPALPLAIAARLAEAGHCEGLVSPCPIPALSRRFAFPGAPEEVA